MNDNSGAFYATRDDCLANSAAIDQRIDVLLDGWGMVTPDMLDEVDPEYRQWCLKEYLGRRRSQPLIMQGDTLVRPSAPPAASAPAASLQAPSASTAPTVKLHATGGKANPGLAASLVKSPDAPYSQTDKIDIVVGSPVTDAMPVIPTGKGAGDRAYRKDYWSQMIVVSTACILVVAIWSGFAADGFYPDVDDWGALFYSIGAPLLVMSLVFRYFAMRTRAHRATSCSKDAYAGETVYRNSVVALNVLVATSMAALWYGAVMFGWTIFVGYLNLIYYQLFAMVALTILSVSLIARYRSERTEVSLTGSKSKGDS